jgi:hypothetical protein
MPTAGLMMTDISYEADQRRMRVRGVCGDPATIREAVEALGFWPTSSPSI